MSDQTTLTPESTSDGLLDEARNGRLFGFRFKDWGDYKSCVPSETPAPLDQLIGTGDSSQTDFQIVKHYISGPRT